MAGIGNTVPKDPSQRARRNKDHVVSRVMEAEPCAQPELPDDRDWPERTRSFWRVWGSSPLTAEFTAAEWDYMIDTAAVHARFWNGDIKAAGELRLRLAKVGATAEDRAKLRITFAQADTAESPKAEPEKASKEHYTGLRLAAGA